jgi:hypothetical protein
VMSSAPACVSSCPLGDKKKSAVRTRRMVERFYRRLVSGDDVPRIAVRPLRRPGGRPTRS